MSLVRQFRDRDAVDVRHSSFTPERVAIENGDGTVLEALDRPRASFAGYTLETPWSTLQLAYFVGTAMWTYLTQPFTFAMPGFQTGELGPWDEPEQQWRRLSVIWPSYLAKDLPRAPPTPVACRALVVSIDLGEIAFT
jgi:hypothetical protein